MDTVKGYLRKRERLSRPWVISALSLYVLGNIILDVPRAFVLIWLRVNGNGRSLLFASNQNQIDNVKKYSLELCNSCSVVKVKNWKSIYSIPQSILALNALYHISRTQQYNHRFLCKEDIHEAAYENSSRYISLILRFLRCRQVVLSREDIKPFSEVGVAAQDLGLLLIVIEHGIFTRSFESFPTTENTFHIFSSEENSSKRTPLAKQICKFNSPLYNIRNSIVEQRLKNGNEPTQILVGDTFNIRKHLIQLAEALEPFGSVKIRLHPGYEQDCGKFSDHSSKVVSMSNARLIVTGISGLALESIFCGISTLIIVTPEDEWAMPLLDIYAGLSHVRVVTLTEFIMNPRVYMNLGCALKDQLTAFQVRMGFENEYNTLPQIVRDLL